MPTDQPAAADEARESEQTITIYILCPSLPSPNRFTFHNIPRSVTVSQLRARLALSLPTRPPPATQRLIFRGKPITADNATLEEVLGPISDGSEYSVHLVLPPAPAPANGPAPTATAGRSSSVSTSSITEPPNPFLPSTTTARTQGLRHRQPVPGAQSDYLLHNASDNFRRQIDALQAQVRGQSTDPVDHTEDLLRRQRELQPGQPPENRQASLFYQRSVTYNGPGAFQAFNAALPPRASTSAPSSSIPQYSTYPTQGPYPYYPGNLFPSASANDRAATPIPSLHNQSSGTALAATVHPQGPESGTASISGSDRAPTPIPPATNVMSSVTGPRDYAHRSHQESMVDYERFISLRQEVEGVERQMNSGILPSAEVLFQLRTRLLNIQDERQQNPASRIFISDLNLQALMARIMALYHRVDQFTLQHQRAGVQVNATSGNQTQTFNTPSNIYLASSPSGYQALLVPPGTIAVDPSSVFAPASSHQAEGASSGGPNIAPIIGAQANPAGQAVVENVLRQAVMNQQRRREANEPGAGRYLRRVWLFIRLYFFCYMISEPGTWTRIAFVALAVLIALLSDTDVPQQLYEMVVRPVQRHLEGLAHIGGPAEQAATAQDTRNPANDGPRNNISAEIWDYLRRAERSIVLLLASLVPGIGERQVEARNAAEAEAERARQEEQERERTREQAQTQADAANNGGAEQPQSAASADS